MTESAKENFTRLHSKRPMVSRLQGCSGNLFAERVSPRPRSVPSATPPQRLIHLVPAKHGTHVAAPRHVVAYGRRPEAGGGRTTAKRSAFIGYELRSQLLENF